MLSCGKYKRKETESPRVVYSFGIVQLEPILRTPKQHFCDNQILTSRYTWWSFIPISLFELFHQISNLTYAILSLVYLFTKGATDFWATVSPLSFAIITAMIKDAIYDIYRQRQDKLVNNRLFGTISLNEDCAEFRLTDKKAANLYVGDIVICKENSEFPCDMILLASSNPHRKVEVTTANLDGETSSKNYYALRTTQKRYLHVYRKCASNNHAIIDIHSLKSLLLAVECEPPNADLHKFEGKITGTSSAVQSQVQEHQELISIENIVLRGSKLVNTNFMIGMPIYTGADTKLSLNAKGVRRKYTAREAKLNTILGSFLLSAVVISILMAIGTTLWSSKVGISIPFLQGSKFTSWEFVQNVFSFSFITTYLLPISLIITIEYQQLIIASFIGNDLNIYDDKQDLKTVAKTVHTADELGQIEFLFSDKTGTLTQNVMLLRTCAAIPSNIVYRIDEGHATHISEWRRSSIFEHIPSLKSDAVPDHGDQLKQGNASIEQLVNEAIISRMPGDLVKPVLVSVLCHSIEVQKADLSVTTPTPPQRNIVQTPVYQASSPDEKALVEASAQLGYVLKSTEIDVEQNVRKVTVVEKQVLTGGVRTAVWTEQVYLIDITLEFNPERKQMTVMARHPNGTYHIHSKGAETSMLSPEASSRSSSQARTQALERVNEFALSGLRTLVLSSRQLTAEEYMTFVSQWRTAMSLFGYERSNAVASVREKIESGLEIVGVTGVEDRLQLGVEDCLCSLREAGIQVWVLTGDKEETAVTVSQASGHFSEDISLIRLTACNDFATTARRILQHLEGMQYRHEHKNQKPKKHSNAFSTSSPIRPTGVSVDEVNAIVATADDDTAPDSRIHKGADELVALQTRLLEHATSAQQTGCRRRVRQPRRKNCLNPGASGEAVGLVVDGSSLTHALHPALRTVFLDLCMNVTTVLCCRMTPLQKASIVQLVRLGLAESDGYRGAPVTAAVGDGGNDVAMILQASVGIGVFGKEGQEAVRAADYAVSQFRFLQRLILVHGHWSYHRVSSTMLLFYEKGVLFVTVQLLLALYSGFTAVSWFDTIYYILYNLSMTAFCYMGFGVFEKVFTAQQLLDHPHLYQLIANQKNLRVRFIVLHVLNGVWQGVVVFFTVFLVLHGTEFHSSAIFVEPSNGGAYHAYDFTLEGASCYVYTVSIANMRLLIYVRDFNLAFLIAVLSTLGFNLVFLLVLQIVVDPSNYHFHTYYKLGRSPNFWITFPLVTYVALFPTIIWRVLSDTWLEKQLDKKAAVPCKPDDSHLHTTDEGTSEGFPASQTTRL
ncbi:Phospholipid-transporting ATPase [Fasciola gigantica]|uniref:Phospholipid-transporting ATPase n=1 Tax=Fasciola gigantica TaxID=46835 RepID=A0A504YFL9_FASGI|nr:Phospholipid-transporting ATPase [Fasciola gigantica]